MLLVIVLAGLAIPAVALLIARRVGGLGRAFGSHIFAFSVFWYVSFPVKAAWLQSRWVITQTGDNPDLMHTLASLAVSTAMALLLFAGAWLGYRKSTLAAGKCVSAPGFAVPWTRVLLFYVLSLIAALLFLSSTVFHGFGWHPFVGYQQNQERLGTGPFFLLASLFMDVLIGVAVGILVSRHLSRRWTVLISVILLGGFAVALLVTVGLNTRRVLAAYCMILALVWVIGFVRSRKLAGGLLLLMILAPIISAPALQFVRYFMNPLQGDNVAVHAPRAARHVRVPHLGRTAKAHMRNAVTGSTCGLPLSPPAEPLGENPLEQISSKFAASVQNVASTFEGVGYLARFLECGDVQTYLLGVDHGRAWLFNGGLAFFPRILWHSKPLSYGSIAEQEYLYPNEFHDGMLMKASLPPGFAVDFLFGFGIVGAIPLCLVAGFLLARAHLCMWSPEAEIFWRGLAIYAFVYMFNFNRGGTAFIQGLEIVGMLLILMYGRAAFSHGFIGKSDAGHAGASRPGPRAGQLPSAAEERIQSGLTKTHAWGNGK